jgi:hypothetical protein
MQHLLLFVKDENCGVHEGCLQTATASSGFCPAHDNSRIRACGMRGQKMNFKKITGELPLYCKIENSEILPHVQDADLT